MAGSPQGGTTTNASNFSLNEDIKLPMGGRYQPTSSVGVFGGPRQTTPSNAQGVGSFVDGGFLPLPPHLRSKAGLPPLQQAPLTPDMMKNYNQPISPELRSNAGLPQPMALNSGVQQMAAPQQGGYNVNTASAQGLQQAQQGAAAEMGYRPMAVNSSGYGSTQVGPTGYSAAQMSGANLDPYMNPYENQVVQQSLDDLERSRLMAQNVGGAQAGAANAFGGSRQGIAEAETNRAFADQAARTASGLRQAGYDRSTQLAGQDIAALNQARQYGAGASNQASLSNQAAINQARQFGSTQNMQAQLANQAAGLSGAQQRLSAGSQLGNLSNLGFGMGQTIQNRMDQQGAMQQALQQQLINAGKQQYAGYTGAPAQSLQYLLQAVGGAPTPQTTTEGYSPGLFDYLTLAGTTYAGIK
jgi:hypothetical protein